MSPIYDYQCICGAVKKDEFVSAWDSVVVCECGGAMERQFPLRFFPDIFPADGIFLEHVSSTGRRFYSKKEMRKYAQENDIEMNAL